MSTETNEFAVDVSGVSKCFKVYKKMSDVAWEVLTRRPRHTDFWALQDVTFRVRKGEVLGVVGRNGSGKSTLLRILTGVLDHTGGKVDVRGKISAILELGTGFHPEYTGRENVLRGGMVLGMSRAEVEAKMDGIIAFSGIGAFIDQPFKTYSSGMQARLTFATATAIDPDILIIDEALATGDAFFVQKSLARIKDICQSGCTALLVSHSTAILSIICQRVMWLENGRIRRIGRALDVVREYDLSVHAELSAGEGRVEPITLPANARVEDKEAPPVEKAERVADPDNDQCVIYRRGPLRIDQVELLDARGRLSTTFKVWEPMTIRVWYSCADELPQETLGLALAINRRSDLMCVMQANTQNARTDDEVMRYADAPFRTRPGRQGMIEAYVNPMQLQVGEYLLSVGILPNIPDTWAFYEYHHHAYQIFVMNNGWSFGSIYGPIIEWRHKPGAVASAAA
jgi:ABC-type polysaccharide/polyol phosphate transport system ATPase subunit